MPSLSTMFRIGAVGGRVFLGLIFFTGGISKLMPFPGVMGPVWLEDRLEPYGLGLFARFIAWSETGIGLLLLSRYAALGAIMLLPLVLNILMVTVSMGWRGTPYVVGGFLAINLSLLAYDFPRWRSVVLDTPGPLRSGAPGERRTGGHSVTLAGLGACLSAPLLYRHAGSLAYLAVATGLSGQLVGAIMSRPINTNTETDA